MTIDPNHKQIATLLAEHKNADAPRTLRASAAMNTATGVVSDMLTATVAPAEWARYAVELGAAETHVEIIDDEAVSRVIVRLGPLPESVLDLTVPEATIVILDRACVALSDFWNEEAGRNDNNDAERMFRNALNWTPENREHARLLRLAGFDSVQMDRWMDRNYPDV